MIATEAAAEDINLQFCNLVVNHDMPWDAGTCDLDCLRLANWRRCDLYSEAGPGTAGVDLE